jgi:aminoglycoside phosphotransferase (APT) family kinase protein
MRSEVATLQFLRKANVPVPSLFDYNLDEGNPIGARYMLLEKTAGQPLRWPLPSAVRGRKS